MILKNRNNVFSEGVSNDKRMTAFFLENVSYKFVACSKIAFCPVCRKHKSCNMVAAVFAQLFKGILCRVIPRPCSPVFGGGGDYGHTFAPPVAK